MNSKENLVDGGYSCVRIKSTEEKLCSNFLQHSFGCFSEEVVEMMLGNKIDTNSERTINDIENWTRHEVMLTMTAILLKQWHTARHIGHWLPRCWTFLGGQGYRGFRDSVWHSREGQRGELGLRSHCREAPRDREVCVWIIWATKSALLLGSIHLILYTEPVLPNTREWESACAWEQNEERQLWRRESRTGERSCCYGDNGS